MSTPPNSAIDCIRLIEASNPQIATNNRLYRNQDRVIRDDPEIAQELFHRLQYHRPDRVGNLNLLGLNERLRMYRYPRAGKALARTRIAGIAQTKTKSRYTQSFYT